MTTPTDPSQNESTYFIDAENAAEMARLTNQAQLITKARGRLFPEGVDLATIHHILDIACGPGEWALDVAHAHPDKQVIGVDISQLMTEYASSQAWVQGVNNVSFKVMNVLELLDFPDNSFELVNARMIAAFMPTTAWPKLLQECLRITQPGGVISLSEAEFPLTNSPAFERMNEMILQAAQSAKQNFSPNIRDVATTAMLERFLRNVGYQSIQLKAYVIDFSAGTEAHTSMYQNFMVALKLVQPYLIKWGVTTQLEAERMYQQALTQMRSNDFCGLWYFLSAWGEKPQSVSSV